MLKRFKINKSSKYSDFEIHYYGVKVYWRVVIGAYGFDICWDLLGDD